MTGNGIPALEAKEKRPRQWRRKVFFIKVGLETINVCSSHTIIANILWGRAVGSLPGS
jgi:hypothetical protein